MKTAVVTGVTGQDGAYLSSFLLGQDYQVIGTYRRTSSVDFWRLRDLGIENHDNLQLVEHDVCDLGSSLRLVSQHQPDECYNLAAQSFVGVSFEQPTVTAHITALGTLNLLEAVRLVNPAIKFYQASTSEMFGKVLEVPQSESTPFYPRSPYGFSKLFAHWATVNYRESYEIFAVCGILFNHESPLRGREFVTRKITDAAVRIKHGMLDHVTLGNLSAERDWGFAGDYVKGMHAMLQHDKADDFVLATGRTVSVRDFARLTFETVGIDIDFVGTGVDEIGVNRATGKTVLRVDPLFFRPAEVDQLVGDATKARELLGWRPAVSLPELVKLMIAADERRILNCAT